MSDLLFHDGVRFADLFQYHFAVVPYLLGDLFLTGAVEVLGIPGATALWIALVMLSLPLALLFYLRGTRIAASAQVVILVLSLYLSTDGFLFMGFLTFRLAVALTIVGIGLVQRLRAEWSAARYAFFCGVVVIGYLIHLSTLLFLAVAIASTAALRVWRGCASSRQEAYLLIPLGVLALFQLAFAQHVHPSTDLPAEAFDWGSWYWKGQHLQWEYLRYYGTHIDSRVDRLLLLAFVLCLAWPVARLRSFAAFRKPEVLELLLLAAVFCLMYVVLPSSFGDASYIDLRPLAVVPIFLMLASAYLVRENSTSPRFGVWVVPALAILLAIGNLVYLTTHLANDNAWMARYRTIVAAIPKRAKVLPMYPGTAQLKPFMHAASFAVIDREAFIPYMFSGNRGNPQTYFRYTHLPYAPPASWYYMPQPLASRVNWGAIACAYDFLLVMKPFDLGRIGVPTTPIVENASASLLAVTKHRCITS